MILSGPFKRNDKGSCNFCDRGELSDHGYHFPYTEVYVMENGNPRGGLAATICEDCLKELPGQLVLLKLKKQ